jgi:mannose-6-phosphate isomerase-like protein (cupin superfamily)
VLGCYAFPQMTTPNFFNIAELEKQRYGNRYFEFLRVPTMSAGVYVLSAGGADPQSPHKEDEMYYVVRGRARMTIDDQERPVKSGSVVFVPANQKHRFHDIEEELTVLVFFAPAES